MLYPCKFGSGKGSKTVQKKDFSMTINQYARDQSWNVDLTGYEVENDGSNLYVGITSIQRYGSLSSTGATAGLSNFRISNYNPNTHVATVTGFGMFSASSLECTGTIFVV